MSLATSKFKSIFSYQLCHKSCKIHVYKFAFHGEHSVLYIFRLSVCKLRGNAWKFSYSTWKFTGHYKKHFWSYLDLYDSYNPQKNTKCVELNYEQSTIAHMLKGVIFYEKNEKYQFLNSINTSKLSDTSCIYWDTA